jgi:DNA invertase Pin-like site-specific DNA recombinase
MNIPREVYGYVRVSGKAQLDGDGFPRQKEAILAFCQSRGWLCKRIFEERAVPGKTEMEDRTAFMEMLALCGGVLPQTIVVERADRVARDLIVGEMLYRECAEAEVEIYAADSGHEMVLADVDPTRKLIRQVLGAMAEWSKNEIVIKTRKARERIRAQTGRCEGAKPFSMTNPKEFAAVLDWIRVSRDRGDSFHVIARQLNTMKFQSPKGCKWGPSYVYKLYTNHLKNK